MNNKNFTIKTNKGLIEANRFSSTDAENNKINKLDGLMGNEYADITDPLNMIKGGEEREGGGRGGGVGGGVEWSGEEGSGGGGRSKKLGSSFNVRLGYMLAICITHASRMTEEVIASG
jgi:hypothetical protein